MGRDDAGGGGCRDFFVATWAEAEALAPLGLPRVGASRGARRGYAASALAGIATPVLNTAAQAARWRAAGGGACDVMLDTGMNRLGLRPDDLRRALDGLAIDTLMSHLASADEESPQNERPAAALRRDGGGTFRRERLSLANSAGIALGADYAFDLTRPGLALYGGVPRARAGRRHRAGRRPASAGTAAPPRAPPAEASATTPPGPRRPIPR